MFIVFRWRPWHYDDYQRRQQREVIVEFELVVSASVRVNCGRSYK